jgi:hypothetical protein
LSGRAAGCTSHADQTGEEAMGYIIVLCAMIFGAPVAAFGTIWLFTTIFD